MSEPLPPNIQDRLLTAIRKIILQEFPQLTYAGLWEYSVTGVNADGTVNGSPTDATIPLPSLCNVPFGSSAAGGTSKPTIGTNFLIEFGNDDGSKYVVVGVDPTVEVATLDASQGVSVGPSTSTGVTLGPAASKDVARTGDSLTVWLPPGLLNGLLDLGGGFKIPIINMPMQVLNALPGLISGGNSKVTL